MIFFIFFKEEEKAVESYLDRCNRGGIRNDSRSDQDNASEIVRLLYGSYDGNGSTLRKEMEMGVHWVY